MRLTLSSFMAAASFMCKTRPMPRYHFDLYNDETVLDDEGRELPNLEAARVTAVREAREMMADSVTRGTINLAHRIDVRDGTGVIATVVFADAVNVVEQPRPDR
jgi:hypothetical protein